MPKGIDGLSITFHSQDGVMETHILDATQAIQIPKGHGSLKDFDGDGVHPIIVDGEYMVKVDDLGKMPTILEAEE